MELVPIVITVLEIVTAFAVVTLTVSYITFKIRQKSKPVSELNSPASHDMKPHFVGNKLKRLTQMTREIMPIVKKEEEKKTYSATSKSKERTKPAERRTENRSEQIPKRIEVMNAPSTSKNPIKKETIQSNVKNKIDLNSLGEDILDKYVDEGKENFYTLKTGKKEDNNKNL